MTHAPAATRGEAVGLRIHPLIEVEVTLFNRVASDAGVTRKTYTKDGNPVGKMDYDKVTGEPVPADQIVKKYETEWGPVYVEDHEIEQLFEIDPKSLVIKTYHPEHLWYSGQHYFPVASYSLEAAKKKIGTKKVPNKVAEQLLAALLQGMREEGVVAVCEVTTRGKPRPAVLLSDGTLWFVRFEEEIREPRPLNEIEVPRKALDDVIGLIRPNITTEPVELTDKRSALIQAFADEKAQAGDFDKPEAPTLVERETADSEDIFAVLALATSQAQNAQAS
jgi:non-homologous end joining protein Ku